MKQFPVSLRALTTFKVLYDSGTTTKAAQHLSISQSGVSRSIAILEKKLKMRLFLRENFRLIPTPEAICLYENISKVVLALENLEDNVTFINKFGIPQINIASIPALAIHFVPRLLHNAFTDLSKQSIILETGTSQSLSADVESGFIDIAFVTLPINNDNIVQEKLISVDAVCILPINHRLAKKSKVNIAELSGEHIIIANKPDFAKNEQLELLKEHRIKPSGYTNCNIISMCEFVALGSGVGIINKITALENQYSNKKADFVIKKFTPQIKYNFAIVYRKQWRDNLAINKLKLACKKIINSSFYKAQPL